ncbi:MAG: exodeoxyribonuclease VII small subunit [Planctomycetota bacterium]|nr:exodeoxyribonuclease VII small subunit [Planctomycetota bacterium]
MAKKKKEDGQDKLSFEQALETLEASVQELEDGQLGLGESLECYQQCVALLKQCHGQLEEATRSVELLSEVTSEGEAVTTALEDEDLSLDEKQATRGERRGAEKSSGNSSQDPPVDDEPGLF